jgi:selenide, water dikinase
LGEQLVVGLETRDDAAIYKLNSEEALVQTLDFFTPIVDDPYLFGQIAAANALSDVYAMGGRPLTAMNMAGFPCSLDMKILATILAGGHDKIIESGAVLAGGHTVDDPEPKYGLSVTGIVKMRDLTTIDKAKPGDALVLTKPIGVGILATALKKQALTEKDMMAAIDSMRMLNDTAAAAAKKVGAKAVTDVTGFGLLGHLYNMAAQSGVSAVVDASEVPIWPGVDEAAKAGYVAGGAGKNRAHLKGRISFSREIDPIMQAILCDPQTSGGLIIAIAANKAEKLVDLLKEAKTPCAAVIGAIEEKEEDHDAIIRCV